MTTGRYIGEDFRSALNWTQERLRTTRPIAEATLWSAIEDKTVVWDDGVYLLEDDDEMEQRKKASIRHGQKVHAVARKWSRIQFRNNKRQFGKKSEVRHRNRRVDPPVRQDSLLPRETQFTEWPNTYDRVLLYRVMAEQRARQQAAREQDDDALP